MSRSYESLMASCLRYISYRPRSRYEITIYMEKRTDDQAVIARVLSRLEEMEYINDQSCADWFISSYRGKKAKGRRVIKEKLKQYGVPSEIIEETMRSLPPEDEESIKILIEKKAKLLRLVPPNEQKWKLMAYLERRGFSKGIIYRLVDEYVENTYNTG